MNRRRIRSTVVVSGVAAATALATVLAAPAALAATTVTVSTLTATPGVFVTAPVGTQVTIGRDYHSPLGNSALEVDTPLSTGDAHVWLNANAGAGPAILPGVTVNAITGLSYWAYRDPASTGPGAPKLQLILDDGETAAFTFNPMANGYSFTSGGWQLVDATKTATGGDAVWHVDGYLNWGSLNGLTYGSTVTWSQIQQQAVLPPWTGGSPDAVDAVVVGNIGTPGLSGGIDGVHLAAASDSVDETIDFEAGNASTDACKNGGWASSAFPAGEWTNQGQCVASLASH